MHQCDKSSGRRRATVGLEQCGCRQETEVRLARKSIGFLPTITSSSSSNSKEQFLQIGAQSQLQQQRIVLAATVQATGREEFLPEAPLPLSFLRNGSTQHSALSCSEIHIHRRNCCLYTILMPSVCGEKLTAFLFDRRASLLMKINMIWLQFSSFFASFLNAI